MKISTKGRYALRMLVDLAEHAQGGCISLGEIAERQAISRKYLEQIVPVLHRAGIVLPSRGYRGGYRLGRAPGDITVGEVLRLTEGNLAPVACLEQDPVQCERCETCRTLPVWRGLYRVVTEYLDSVTLADLLAGGGKLPAEFGS